MEAHHPYSGFLSEDMTYSCAIYKDLDGDLKFDADRGEWSGGQGLKRLDRPLQSFQSFPREVKEKDELYEAQIRKLDHIIEKARIMPGHRVLEIG